MSWADHDPYWVLARAIVAQALKDAQDRRPKLSIPARHWLMFSPQCAWLLDMTGLGSQGELRRWVLTLR
jgi:hypothetical protein